MPKHLWMPRDAQANERNRSGLSVSWTKTAQRLDFSGWYDSFVGIPGDQMTLRQFFDALGITKKDCEKAWKAE